MAKGGVCERGWPMILFGLNHRQGERECVAAAFDSFWFLMFFPCNEMGFSLRSQPRWPPLQGRKCMYIQAEQTWNDLGYALNASQEMPEEREKRESYREC